jgi:hypothetical protein
MMFQHDGLQRAVPHPIEAGLVSVNGEQASPTK